MNKLKLSLPAEIFKASSKKTPDTLFKLFKTTISERNKKKAQKKNKI